MSRPNSSANSDNTALSGGGPPGVRWWPAVMIVLVYGLTLLCTWVIFANVEMPRGLQVLITYLASTATVVLLLVWELFFARLRSPWWGRVQMIQLIIVGTLFALFRIKEADGDAWFTFVWRWTDDPYVNLEPNDKLASETTELIANPETDYPGFLGANRDGIVTGISLETDWQSHPPKELWRIGKDQRESLGAAFSSFAIVGEYAFTQELRGNAEYVSCFHLRTGELIWRNAQTDAADAIIFESVVAGNGPRATPTVHDGRVYACGGAGVLACFDAASGERLWSADVVKQTAGANIQWGYACSPLIVGSHVIVAAGGGGSAQLVGYRIDSNEPRPQPAITGGDGADGGVDFYDSPSLRTICGVQQILHINNKGLAAFDPQTLDLLWRSPWPWEISHPLVSQPVVLPDDHVFLSAAYSSGDALLRVERDERGDFSAKLLWQKNTLKSKFANVLVQGDHLYGLDARILVCIEWRTGKRKWKVRAGSFGHGQIMLVDDVILIQAETGEVVLVRASPDKFEKLASIQPFEDRTWNNPALAGKYLLVRNHLKAVCYELPLRGK
ncbi:MAG: PQQ-like beta-propeller repeat protein [Pirellulales bacterium]|nr:PQQ-like beta-propeller repeat protein [Pirellulales bacterium]